MALEQFKNIDLTIEHANANNFIPRQFSSEGDIQGRTLTVQITENGVPAEITGAILRLVWTNKTTGLAGIEDFKSIDAANGIFEVTYPRFNTRGTVEMAIQIYYQNKVTTTRKFEATVQPINGNFKTIIESQQLSALVTALNEATKANPRDSFSSVSELQATYPNGATGTYLVKNADGTYHTYMYKNGGWVDLGSYQGSLVANEEIIRIANVNYASTRIANKGNQLFKNINLVDPLTDYVANVPTTTLSVATKNNTRFLNVTGQKDKVGNGFYQISREYMLYENSRIHFVIDVISQNENDVLCVQVGQLLGSDTASFQRFSNTRFRLKSSVNIQTLEFDVAIPSYTELQYDRIKTTIFSETATNETQNFFIRIREAKIIPNDPVNELPLKSFRKIDSNEVLPTKYNQNNVEFFNSTSTFHAATMVIPTSILSAAALDRHRLEVNATVSTSDINVSGTFYLLGYDATSQLVLKEELLTVSNQEADVKYSLKNVISKTLSRNLTIANYSLQFSFNENTGGSVKLYDMKFKVKSFNNKLIDQDEPYIYNASNKKKVSVTGKTGYSFDLATEDSGRSGFTFGPFESWVVNPDKQKNHNISFLVNAPESVWVDMLVSIRRSDSTFYEYKLASVFIEKGITRSINATFDMDELIRRGGGSILSYRILLVNSSNVKSENKPFVLLDRDYTIYTKRASVYRTFNGDILNDLPTVNLTGDVSKMSKEDEVTLDIEYRDEHSSFNAFAKTKWQGSTSIAFPKKNYNIKLYSDENTKTKKKIKMKNWQETNRFNLKANWIDVTHAKNIVNANLIREAYLTNPSLNANLINTSNIGQIDGFPIHVFINNIYQGIYTFNLGKKDELVGMQDEEMDVLITGEQQNSGTWFKKSTTNLNSDEDWGLEYPDDVTPEITDSFSRLLKFVNESTDEEFVKNIDQYLNKKMLFDYMISTMVFTLADQYGKNQFFATWDRQVWTPVMYDLDTSVGTNYNGTEVIAWNTPWDDYRFFKDNKLYNRTYTLFKNELRKRYEQLRVATYSETNIISKYDAFINKVGQANYARDLLVWPDIPSKYISNAITIRRHISLRLQYLDNNFAK